MAAWACKPKARATAAARRGASAGTGVVVDLRGNYTCSVGTLGMRWGRAPYEGSKHVGVDW